MKAETLKKSILQFAMQGKLVTQDPNDEPASELLKRIKAEKEQLIKDGKIKKEKPLPPITTDEIPYELPQGWEWVRFNEIYKFIDYRGKTPNKLKEGVPLITAKNIKQGFNDYKVAEYISEKEFEDRQSRGVSKLGDILFTTEAPMGNVSIADMTLYSTGQRVICMQQYDTNIINNKFIMYYLLSEQFQGLLSNKQTGTTVTGIKAEKLKLLPLIIPPLAEQQRIVEKLEEILPLVEEYGKNEEILSEMNKKLPKQIRQSILQYAVQGKLVPQNSNDEPASELLKRIKAEKEQLIKDGKIKKEKPIPPITEDEIPYELPQGWEWVKLGEICSKIVDGDHNPPSGHPVKTNYLMLSASNINYDKIVDLDKVRYLTKETFDEENKRTNLHVDDILFTIVGTLGRTCIYDGNLNICFQRSVSVLTTLIYNKYLKIVLDSPCIQFFMQKNATGTAQKGFYLNQVSNLIIPLPPLTEQQRIVAKVEELMQIVDKLE